MTAVEMTYGMSFGAFMGWMIGQGIHVMFDSDDEAAYPSSEGGPRTSDLTANRNFD